jgi:hypothetical protein
MSANLSLGFNINLENIAGQTHFAFGLICLVSHLMIHIK